MQGSYSSEFFKFHDFPRLFPWPFLLSMTSGLAVTFENFQNFTCLSIFFYLKKLNRNKRWYPQTACRSRCLITPLYLILSLLYHQPFTVLSSVVTNLPNKTLIFNDFQGPKIKFHDFPGLENEILKFHGLPGFPWPVRTLLYQVSKNLVKSVYKWII